MTVKNRTTIIYGSLSIVILGITYLIVNKIQKDKVLKELDRMLNEHIGELGGIDEYGEYFNWKKFLAGLPSVNYIVPSDTTITNARTQLHSAFGEWWSGGDNEAAIYSIFRSLRDGVAVAMVSKSYENNYGKNLIEKLKENLDSDELQEVINIISKLPKYTLIN